MRKPQEFRVYDPTMPHEYRVYAKDNPVRSVRPSWYDGSGNVTREVAFGFALFLIRDGYSVRVYRGTTLIAEV